MARTKQVAPKQISPIRCSCPELRNIVIAVSSGYDVKLCPRAVKILHDSAEVYTGDVFAEASFFASLEGREDVTDKDVRLAARMLGRLK